MKFDELLATSKQPHTFLSGNYCLTLADKVSAFFLFGARNIFFRLTSLNYNYVIITLSILHQYINQYGCHYHQRLLGWE
ncbi:hypothetical protein NIES4071_26570 [Calothrix sp. NIES-4071]|nr:hypothetical protein NIES4071_26570 [Calothrix sp. NIES-4071]BAZ56979.1 hypothetical protein NIES4105_26510 [Calothrix sp. NIES-4105]